MILVWFNGPSRQSIIETTPPKPVEIGCNYIRRDRSVPHVVAYDASVVNSIELEAGVSYHTRTEHVIAGWRGINDPLIQGVNSGIAAVILATQLSKDNIYIIGCDWGINNHTVYDYGRGELRKYSNPMRKVLKRLTQRNSIHVVSDQLPDVPVPIISKYRFLEKAYK